MKTAPIGHKNPLNEQGNITLTCPRGLAPFVAEEVRGLGLVPLDEASGSTVHVRGAMHEAMRICAWLRCAGSVLMELTSFEAANADALYRTLSDYPWESIIEPGGYITVTSTVDNPTIKDSRYASLKFKDAVVDRIKSKSGRRPDSGPERRGVVLHLRWKDNKASVFLDAAGETLSKRGYRKHPGLAPLKEGLAAAIVLASGWSGEGVLVNPMCGSGTITIEAALIALGRAPGLFSRRFGFMHARGFDPSEWQNIRGEAGKAGRKNLPGRIIATDNSAEAIENARSNARTAGVEHLIEFSVCDFADTPVPEGNGVVIMNPPYGTRIGEQQKLEPLYALMGDFMKQNCEGKNGYIFTGNPALAKKIGLRTKSRRQMYNGAIECRLLEYEMYKGTRKVKG